MFSSTIILSLKALLISTGVVSIAIFFKLSVPLLTDFAIHELPLIWSVIISWLKPPYLYVVFNAIILTIVASFRFHRKLDYSEPLIDQTKPTPMTSDIPMNFGPQLVPVPDSVPVIRDISVVKSPVSYESDEDEVFEVTPVVVNGLEMEEDEDEVLDVKPVLVNGLEVDGDEDENEFAISRWNPPERVSSPDYKFPSPQKPSISRRFSQRKPLKASTEGGRALRRAAKPKRRETLESTWKTITDGRQLPLTRHLKKSDTWENHGRHDNVDTTSSHKNVKKSENFRDRTNNELSPETTEILSSLPGSAKLRREPSPSQDELNRRVEAFINKFNEEMRLQRQESLNKYLEMVNRGAS